MPKRAVFGFISRFFKKGRILGSDLRGIGVLKGLQEYAWRRGLIPERPDWSTEMEG